MQNAVNPLPDPTMRPDSASARLNSLIADLPPDRVTLAEIRDLLGDDGLLLFNTFLAVAFVIPFPVPGARLLFGGAIMMIAVSRLLHRPLWLPKRFLVRQLPAGKLSASLNRGIPWIHRLERISRPHRLGRLVSGGYPGAVNNLALVLSAALLMAPLGLIPFSKTLPALAILFFTLGFLQRDGLCVLVGHVVNIATIVYLAVLLGGGGAALAEMLLRTG